MKPFHNFITYFNVIWVICGEITYTSNIFEIDAAKINFKVFSKDSFLLNNAKLKESQHCASDHILQISN